MQDQDMPPIGVSALKSRFEAMASSLPSSSPEPDASPSSYGSRKPPPPRPIKPKPATLPSRTAAHKMVATSTTLIDDFLTPESYTEDVMRRYRSSSNPESGASRDEEERRRLDPPKRERIKNSPSVPDLTLTEVNETIHEPVLPLEHQPVISHHQSLRRPAPPPPPGKSFLSKSAGNSTSTTPARVRSPDAVQPTIDGLSDGGSASPLSLRIMRFDQTKHDPISDSPSTDYQDPFAGVDQLDRFYSRPPALPPRLDSSSTTSPSSSTTETFEKPVVPPRPTLRVEPDLPPPLPQRSPSSPHSRLTSLPSSSPSAPPLPARAITPTPLSATDIKLAPEWHAPPPPCRNIGLKEKLPAVRPVIKSPQGEEDDSSEDEDAEATEDASLSKLPDATFANRKPPRLEKDLTVHAKSQHFLSWAIKGSIICTGSTQVKIWDQTNGEQIASIQFRGEQRIEKMAFKTAVHNPADEGRYLWCGTKDGQLFELDILHQSVVDHRANAHSYCIRGIYASGLNMITVDDSGKVLTWLPNDQSDFGISTPPSLSSKNIKTQRVGEKLGFVAMIGDKLWTSVGPVNQMKAKAPVIRVYDPKTDGPFVVTQRPLSIPSADSTFVGGVTCGTIIPSHPDRLYLGHETGHITIWSMETYTCLSLAKISQTKITALQGVTKFLWAGYGNGFIHVYDVDFEPWKVLKAWRAHKDPIVTILIDPYTLWAMGKLYVISICASAVIHFWDGLMKSDWRDNRLLELQPTFCTFRSVRVLLCTYNLDASRPDHLLNSVRNQQFFHDFLSGAGSPDVIVFGFQEMIDLENKRLTAKTILLGKKKPDQKFSDNISQGYRLWHDELVKSLKVYMPSDFPYTVTHVESLVGLFTCVFVKDTESIGLRDVSVSTIKTGLKGRYGNKGAILSRFVMDDSSMCFVNCHLAAGQNHRRQRNKNLTEILEKESLNQTSVQSAYIGGGDGTMVFDHEICFLSGDMNYRIDLRRDFVFKCIEEGDLKSLLVEDQLNKEIKSNARLRSFKEAQILFNPTYKYDPGTDNYDTSAKLRIPAWCDRILWRADHQDKVKNLRYQRHEVDISDHRPVSALFEVQIKSIIPEKFAKTEKQIDDDWKNVEASLMEKARTFYRRV